MLSTVRAVTTAALFALAAWTGAAEPVAHAMPAPAQDAEPQGSGLCTMVCTANLERCQLACIDGPASGEPECSQNCEAVYEICMKRCRGGGG